ncbi:GNAT family N-acetyltransferase [Serpentinicella sp. ANB-PHB4]|uniref:GNAT family N-acetyltransferase n=1 Tax=Serpentinicella sp. ANB-PHB4 TaxID=3074076 RepID=UPI0028678C56|nr:GNAT family N-acetyltransferase [Serpentinicella sp. ANB-PHB4]MDR5659835.1 GNAT family N-acetyltransferase [Serpentinicella sp. ANB-PHB4]
MTEKEFRQFWEIYEYSFPEAEKRRESDQRKLMKNKRYSIKTYCEKGDMVGFITFWHFDTFTFIEHFAIKEALRGSGYGRKILEDVKKHYGDNLVLEVELPNETMAIRRIDFYEKAGFYYNNFDYIQPPLKKEGKSIPLRLMSSPVKLEEKDFEAIKDILYTEVYQVS